MKNKEILINKLYDEKEYLINDHYKGEYLCQALADEMFEIFSIMIEENDEFYKELIEWLGTEDKPLQRLIEVMMIKVETPITFSLDFYSDVFEYYI